MRWKGLPALGAAVLFASLALVGCTEKASNEAPPAGVAASGDLNIVAGSENKSLEPIIKDWAAQKGYTINITYQGSVDMSRSLQSGTDSEFDAVWPAHSLWLQLGDTRHVVKNSKSIMRSPVVLGVKKSIASRLGWVGKTNVTMSDIIKAAEAGEFRLGQTSASQSNSGATSFLSVLYAVSGHPDILTSEHLKKPEVRTSLKNYLSAVDRGSGSSGWLKDSMVQHPDQLDAMINYEAMIIEANNGSVDSNGNKVPGLVAQGREPLYVVYPSDAIMVSDSPLGYIDKGDAGKQKLFDELQTYLLSKEVQDQIVNSGRRAGSLGMEVSTNNRTVWNPDWGIDTKRVITPVPTPDPQVITEALNLYQTVLRKPSLTVWVLDASGSMDSNGGIGSLHLAMRELFDPERAAANLLQVGPDDVNIIITFSDDVRDVWVLVGNDPTKLRKLSIDGSRIEAGGGTDLYAGLIRAIEEVQKFDQNGQLYKYLPAIVAMTDGQSDRGNFEAFTQKLNASRFGRDIPIHAIAFGSDADTEQLKQLTDLTVGKLFDSRDLTKSLREVRGYN
jgi:Ca-activated chloride channel family protein